MSEPRERANISQAQADAAAAEAAQFWPEFGRRWPWTRQRSLAPVYQLIGETTVALLRAFPEIQRSNQARWYARSVRDTPAIYALFPEAFREQAQPFLAGGDPRELEGKQVVSFIYLTPGAGIGGEPDVAKTLLASTTTGAPYYRAQLAHELLNCFCATGWDGATLRSGVRRANWGAGARLQRGGALNDLLLDTLLIDFLPRATNETLDSLIEGTLGPYWRIADAYARRLRALPIRAALFDADEQGVSAFERALDVTLNLRDAAGELDRRLLAHDWQAVATLLDAG